MTDYHHIFWKTPFQTVIEIREIFKGDLKIVLPLNIQKDFIQMDQAIQKIDQAVNRFQLPNNDQTAGEQGKKATEYAPYFQILKYSVKFIKEQKIILGQTIKDQLQYHLENKNQYINSALKQLDDMDGEKFMKTLRDHILKIIPQMKQADQIPEGFPVMIDYRYKIAKAKPESPHKHFAALRRVIENIINFVLEYYSKEQK